jgi:hypothetical protein
MNQAQIDSTWKSLGDLQYFRRLGAFNDVRRGGMDDEKAVAYVQKMFGDLAAKPFDQAAHDRGCAEARKIEDGE